MSYENPSNLKQVHIAETANSPENEMILAFARLRHPKNKEKYVDHLYKAHELHALKYGGRVPSKEEIAADLEERIKKEESATNFDYKNDGLCRTEPLHLGFETEEGKKLTTKEWSMAESHEKGHIVRMEGLPHLPGLPETPENEDQEYFDILFFEAVDPSVIPFPWTDEEYQKFLDEGKTKLTKEEQKMRIDEYNRSGGETLERMSQLKNYFGMQGDEVFTKEHLDYAREHYIKDRSDGFENIQDFFKMITPEKEARFLELINSIGV